MPTRRQFMSVLSGRDRGDERRNIVVCVFLRGGADTLNLVVPYADDDYYRARPSIAIAAPSASAASSIRIDDRFGFHPAMRPLIPAFREGRLAIVHGVGSDNASGSHFEAQDQMEHGAGSGDATTGGWIGRYLHDVWSSTPPPLAAIAIGATLPESLRGAASSNVIGSVDDLALQTADGDAERVRRALTLLYHRDAGALGRPGTDALRLLERVESIRSSPYHAEGGAAYPDDAFGSGLREIARLAKGDVGLEVACIDLDGWDTHFIQGGADGLQASLIGRFATGLAAFDADLGDLRQHVTVVAMTEFGRRIYENSSGGTDHGRGFAMLALGGRVRGGAIYGEWPGLDREEGPLGPGGVRVLVDYRSVLAEVLTGAAGTVNASRVFPGFRPVPLGLTG